MADVRLTDEAAAGLSDLPNAIHNRMQKLIARLRAWPQVSGAKPLRGNLTGHFRLRTGDYRLQFRVDDRVIVVERIGHRDGFYE
jgi:mRNA-degrading endonuclease RelE of RelBE toxin-antitoxin system